jgi:hypothetical protein
MRDNRVAVLALVKTLRHISLVFTRGGSQYLDLFEIKYYFAYAKLHHSQLKAQLKTSQFSLSSWIFTFFLKPSIAAGDTTVTSATLGCRSYPHEAIEL